MLALALLSLRFFPYLARKLPTFLSRSRFPNKLLDFKTAVLLSVSSLTVMAGALIAPALPEIGAHFSEQSSEQLNKLVLTIPALAIVLFSGPIGSLADCFGRKRLLLASLLWYGGIGFAALFSGHIYILLLLRFALGLGVAGIMTAATALVGDYFVGQARAAYLGMQASFMSLGGILFLNLGGFLAEWDWRWPFALYLFGILLFPFALFLPEKPLAKTSASDLGSEQLAPDERWRVLGIYALGFSAMSLFYLIPVYMPFLLKSDYGKSNSFGGFAISVATVGSAFSSLFYASISKRLRAYKIYSLALSFVCFGFLAIAFAPGIAFVLLGILCTGLGLGIAMPTGSTLILATVPDGSRGKYLGGLSSAVFLGQFVSALLGEFFALLSFSLYFSGAIFVLCIIALLLATKKP